VGLCLCCVGLGAFVFFLVFCLLFGFGVFVLRGGSFQASTALSSSGLSYRLENSFALTLSGGFLRACASGSCTTFGQKSSPKDRPRFPYLLLVRHDKHRSHARLPVFSRSLRYVITRPFSKNEVVDALLFSDPLHAWFWRRFRCLSSSVS